MKKKIGDALFGIGMGLLALTWILSIAAAIIIGIISCFIPNMFGMRMGDIAGICFGVFMATTVVFGMAIWIIESGKPLMTITTHTRTVTTYR